MIILHNGENGQKSKENTKPDNFIATQASFHLIAFFFVTYLFVTFNRLQIQSVIKSLIPKSLQDNIKLQIESTPRVKTLTHRKSKWLNSYTHEHKATFAAEEFAKILKRTHT